jgi:hypothetical protein
MLSNFVDYVNDFSPSLGTLKGNDRKVSDIVSEMCDEGKEEDINLMKERLEVLNNGEEESFINDENID